MGNGQPVRNLLFKHEDLSLNVGQDRMHLEPQHGVNGRRIPGTHQPTSVALLEISGFSEGPSSPKTKWKTIEEDAQC